MTDRLARIRLLPVTIFVAALMLTVRVGYIWDGVDGLIHPTLAVSEASAQQQPAAEDAEGAAAEASDPDSADESMQQPAPDHRGAGLLEDDPTLLTAAESRIDRKVGEMKKLQQTIDELIKQFDQQQTAKTESLVKIYENMKPKDAARIFEELDMDTLLMVAERMKERKLAPIMAKMNPEKAREVTVELARLRNLPTAAAAETGG